MIRNFLKVLRETTTYTDPENSMILKQINAKQSILSNIIIKLLKIKNKDNLFNIPRKNQIKYTEDKLIN